MTLLLQRPNLYLYDGNLVEIFVGSEIILFKLVASEFVSPVIKENIIKTLLRIDLSQEILAEIAKFIFKCKNSNLVIDYLPIIHQHYDKIRADQKEVLHLCYFNHYHATSRELSKSSRVALMNFFATALMSE